MYSFFFRRRSVCTSAADISCKNMPPRSSNRSFYLPVFLGKSQSSSLYGFSFRSSLSVFLRRTQKPCTKRKALCTEPFLSDAGIFYDCRNLYFFSPSGYVRIRRLSDAGRKNSFDLPRFNLSGMADRLSPLRSLLRQKRTLPHCHRTDSADRSGSSSGIFRRTDSGFFYHRLPAFRALRFCIFRSDTTADLWLSRQV